ncbi:MAG: family 20 glycosylhydrolase, partial [Balneolaceae bacterium]
MTKSIQIYLTLSLILILSGCGQSGERVQDELLQIETSSYEITWELVSNIQEEGTFQAIIHLQNNSENLLPASGWALYFNSIRMLVPESFPDQFRVSHINGDFFKLEPTRLFRPLESGESLSIPYSGHHFKIKKGDAPQGFYFVFDNQRIENVEEIEVLPFISDEQTKRSPDDQLRVPTAESEFHRNDALTQLEYSQINKITPTPVSIHEGVGVFQFSGEIPVVHHALFIAEAEYLSDYLMQSFGMISNTVLLPNESDDPVIVLDQIYERLDSDEAYRLDVTPEQITISANDSKGVFYGIQSLKALIENRESEELQIQSVHIEDTPAFPYRGMHLDVARNFQSVNDVKQLLDLMAMYKMNRFHFHLTDDEGWRLAIDPLPELVQIGGRRGHTEIESAYLIPSYGSGPDPTPGSSFGSGWYSRDQYIDILRYAAERHIEVIPEIDVPGHARAAIIAMEARTERLLREGNDEEANLYRLVEEGDESEYLSIQNFNDNVINVCIESTYRFLDLVIDELVLMHEMAD